MLGIDRRPGCAVSYRGILILLLSDSIPEIVALNTVAGVFELISSSLRMIVSEAGGRCVVDQVVPGAQEAGALVEIDAPSTVSARARIVSDVVETVVLDRIAGGKAGCGVNRPHVTGHSLSQPVDVVISDLVVMHLVGEAVAIEVQGVAEVENPGSAVSADAGAVRSSTV